MNIIFRKSTKAGKEPTGALYVRVKNEDILYKFPIGFTIRQKEWEKYKKLDYKAGTMMVSIGISYCCFANIMLRLKTYFENDFDPETASVAIQGIKSEEINGIPMAPLGEIKGKRAGVLLERYLDDYIEELASGKKKKKGRSVKVSDGYLANMRTLRSNILKFESALQTTITLEDVNMDFQREFVNWCVKTNKKNNTISVLLSNIRTVMKYALENKVTDNDAFKNSEFVTMSEDVDHIFLNPAQINQMYTFDLWRDQKVAVRGFTKRKLKKLELAKDIFVIGCLTGQRVSDYSRISSEMIVKINGIYFIDITQNKTGKEVLIPLDERVGALLNKYKGKLPVMRYDTILKDIRVIAELMGWTAKTRINTGKGDKGEGRRFCDLIGTHTARRSFATNAYAAGVPLSSIMAITGHSTEGMLRRYLKLQKVDKAILAARDFKGVIKMRQPCL